jgi:prepilin-type N-terminal cleavage/methylation domain-containing protein/prepilin-type processing-associated H-X9-DG protein
MVRVSRGFTIIELIVVISIVTLLIAILFPALGAARQHAQQSVCMSNLRQLGTGFVTYAVDNVDTYTSGSTEYGVGANHPTEVTQIDRLGWIADQVNGRYGLPGQLLCPTAVARLDKWYEQASDAGDLPPARFTDLMARGYNSNYTQSWYMAHAEVRTAGPVDHERRFVGGGTPTNWGPLRGRLLDRVPTSRVPLMADGRPKDTSAITIAGGSFMISKNMTDGPRMWFNGSGYTTLTGTTRFGHQDWTNWGFNHMRRRGSANAETANQRGNVVFADGHVVTVEDRFTILNGAATPDGEMDNLDLRDVAFDGVLSLGRRSGSPNQLQ